MLYLNRLFIVLCLVLFVLSCSKIEEYPTSFHFQNKAGVTQVVSEYSAPFIDSTLDIYGLLNSDTLHFHFKEGPNGLVVGEKQLSEDGIYQLTYVKNNIRKQATEGYIQIDYINRFMDFTFEALFDDGDSIKNGVGEYVWFNMGNLSLVDPQPFVHDSLPVDTNLWVGITDGLYADVVGFPGVFYTSVPDLDIIDTDSSIIIKSLHSIMHYQIKIEFEKPIKDLIGINFSLEQNMQTKVKMNWDYDPNGINHIPYHLSEGEIQVLSFKNNRLYFIFKGRMFNPADPFSPWDKEIKYSFGKNIIW